MKILITMFLILGFTFNAFAIQATETQKTDTVEITITFTKAEFDLFTLDKGDAKEWIRNACEVNLQDHTKRIKEDLTKDIKPSDADFNKKIKELKAEKLKREREIR